MPSGVTVSVSTLKRPGAEPLVKVTCATPSLSGANVTLEPVRLARRRLAPIRPHLGDVKITGNL